MQWFIATFHVKHGRDWGVGPQNQPYARGDPEFRLPFPQRLGPWREVPAKQAPAECPRQDRCPLAPRAQLLGEVLGRCFRAQEVDPLRAGYRDPLRGPKHLGQLTQGPDVDRPMRLGGPAASVLFEPATRDRHVADAELAHGPLEETGLLLSRLENGESRPGPDDRQRYAGESASASDIQRGSRWRRLNVDGVQGIQDVPGVEHGAIAARYQGELRYLRVDELAEAREQLHRVGRKRPRLNPLGDSALELTEVRLEVTR